MMLREVDIEVNEISSQKLVFMSVRRNYLRNVKALLTAAAATKTDAVSSGQRGVKTRR